MPACRNLESNTENSNNKKICRIPKSRFGTAERKNLMKHLKPNDLESVWWKGELIYPPFFAWIILHGDMVLLHFNQKPKRSKTCSVALSKRDYMCLPKNQTKWMSIDVEWGSFFKHKWCGKILYGHTINAGAEMQTERKGSKKKCVSLLQMN